MPKELPFHVVFSPRFSLIHVALVCSSGDMLLSSRLNSANLMKSLKRLWDIIMSVYAFQITIFFGGMLFPIITTSVKLSLRDTISIDVLLELGVVKRFLELALNFLLHLTISFKLVTHEIHLTLIVDLFLTKRWSRLCVLIGKGQFVKRLRLFKVD